MRRVMRKISARWNNAILVRIVYAWRDDTTTEKHNRIVIARFALKLKNHAVHGAFATWQWLRSERQRFRKLAFHIFGRVVSGKTAAGFHQWAHKVREARDQTEAYLAAEAERASNEAKVARAVRKMLHGTLARMWETWHDLVEEIVRHRRICKRFAAKMRNAGMLASWRSWGDYVTARIDFRKLAFRIFNRIVGGKLASAYHTWT